MLCMRIDHDLCVNLGLGLADKGAFGITTVLELVRRVIPNGQPYACSCFLML